MSATDIRQLIRHMEWADSLVWRSVLGAPGAAANEDMRVRLHHIHLVQHAYLQVWRRRATVTHRELDSFRDTYDIVRWAASFYPAADAFAAALDDGELAREVHFPWAEQLTERFGTPHPATVAQTFLQIALHSTHHRGQALMHLRQLGGEPPLTDFIAWIWYGQPPAEWPAQVSSVRAEP